MAVEWRHLIFGDVDSADYGIYISGDGVYNAPERAVEFVDVPGRNGAIALDQGRYNNITVTYPAGTFAKTQEEFRENLSAFRNAILSQKGYQRLEDTYHPEEYRMGVYSSGLEVSPAGYNQAGEFELIFNCKPQRWFTVGALPIPVDSGDVLENPTLFESSPLLEVEGYGTINLNGHEISLDNTPLDRVTLINRHMDGTDFLSSVIYAANFSKTYKFDRSLLDTGDDIYIGSVNFRYDFQYVPNNNTYSGVTYVINETLPIIPTVSIGTGGSQFGLQMTSPIISTSALSPSDSEIEFAGAITLYAAKNAGGTDTLYASLKIKIGYDYITYELATGASGTVQTRTIQLAFTSTPTSGDSSIVLLGNPTYIDCETGEAYRIEDSEYKSSNAKVSIGADLPTLSPGLNKVTFDNTITDLKIAPRWWRV